jgi:hypothetical protein
MIAAGSRQSGTGCEAVTFPGAAEQVHLRPARGVRIACRLSFFES